MHEMSICEGIVQVIEAQAAEQDYQRVKTVWLEIGVFSGVEVEALKFCFEAVCRDTIAAGSVLQIEEIPGRAWCMQCATTLTVTARYEPCPECGSYQLQVTGGDEMKIKELEVA